MGSGIARDLHTSTGRRVAFGDGRRIIWAPAAHTVYQNNPRVARPGDEGAADIQWVKHYAGNRLYGNFVGERLIFNQHFRASRGEFFFYGPEPRLNELGRGAVVIEPQVKSGRINKQWDAGRYRLVAKHLMNAGYRVVQFVYTSSITPVAPGVQLIQTNDIRQAAAAMASAKLFIGPEGGLHHAAAAVGLPGVVIFGGYIHPSITGYDLHTNLFVGAAGCGVIGHPCAHCRAALDSITVDDVLSAAVRRLSSAVDKHPSAVDVPNRIEEGSRLNGAQ